MLFWKIIYNTVFVPVMWFGLQLLALFNKKIMRGIEGRKDLFEHLQHQVSSLHAPVRLWFHSSSLGEFEQAKPIIHTIKNKYPTVDIVATFFSPSGYDHSKNYKYVDCISYIPFDSRSNAERFISVLQPTAAIMVRYDIWPNIIWRLHQEGIPIFIANATMKESSLRSLPLVKQFHTSLYSNFSHILTVSHNDKKLFESFNPHQTKIEVVGDSRFDQVVVRSEEAKTKTLLPSHIVHGKKIFIVGQSWEEDEEVILPVLTKMQSLDDTLLTIIVPHEPTIDHLDQLESQLESNTSVIRFSEINNYNGENVILIDSVGVLFSLYKYAHVVYIGGSFRQGIHNVLEPAVFGVPVIYGPKHTNSQEAVALSEKGGGFVINDENELFRILRMLLDEIETRYKAGKIAQSFVHENCGATERFLTYLDPYLH